MSWEVFSLHYFSLCKIGFISSLKFNKAHWGTHCIGPQVFLVGGIYWFISAHCILEILALWLFIPKSSHGGGWGLYPPNGADYHWALKEQSCTSDGASSSRQIREVNLQSSFHHIISALILVPVKQHHWNGKCCTTDELNSPWLFTS